MAATDVLAALKSVVRAIVPASVRRARYERRFFATRRWENLHHGRFDSFEAARAYARAHGADGRYALDHDAWAGDRATNWHTHDYPVAFWLERVLEPGMRVFDLGGSVGVTHRLLQPRLPVLSTVDWIVGELPEVVARAVPSPNLSFTDDVAAMNRCDVLHSAGTLQFMDESLASMLARLDSPPPVILVNRLPTTAGAAFVTLQNTGVAIAPCAVSSRDAFVASLEALGYRLEDEWRCLENSLEVPFERTGRVDFRGFHFARAAP